MTAIGCVVPNGGPVLGRLSLASMAEAIVGAGVHRAWLSDHLVLVDPSASRYPYAVAGGAPARVAAPTTDWHEALVCAAYLAGSSPDLTIGTAVLVLAQRDPVVVAKMAATLDRVSAGRFVLGVGMGWAREESEFLGYDFASRGARFERAIATVRAAWTDEFLDWEGRRVYVRPQPRPGLPILVGGNGPRAVDRALALGDGWIGLVTEDPAALERLDACLHRIRAAPDKEFHVAVRVVQGPDRSPDRLHALVRALADRGVDEVIVEPAWDDPAVAGDLLRALVRPSDARPVAIGPRRTGRAGAGSPPTLRPPPTPPA